ncbi:helix-turn-helix transcriptional regulator [Ochrobactrum anthropi ATCC 49188]|nr:helix-turn-helix transcriptional regulator [Brucella anthropi ATCC 49188]
MEIREVLAQNLKALRQARGLSQEELAHRADIDRTYVSSLERCVYSASIDVVDRLAIVLEVEASDLLKNRLQHQFLSDLECCRKNPTIITPYELAQALGVSHVALVQPDGDGMPH